MRLLSRVAWVHSHDACVPSHVAWGHPHGSALSCAHVSLPGCDGVPIDCSCGERLRLFIFRRKSDYFFQTSRTKMETHGTPFVMLYANGHSSIICDTYCLAFPLGWIVDAVPFPLVIIFERHTPGCR